MQVFEAGVAKEVVDLISVQARFSFTASFCSSSPFGKILENMSDLVLVLVAVPAPTPCASHPGPSQVAAPL